MYEYVNDKTFLGEMRRFCGEIMQDLCHELSVEYDIGANFYLVGSGARNLIVQNAREPIDLDYNLEILSCEDYEDCYRLKSNVQRAFNSVLREYNLRDCEDSTSSLTTKKIHFNDGNTTEFSMDVTIVCKDEIGNQYRLIHKKSRHNVIYPEEYYWSQAPNSKHVRKKAKEIKDSGMWLEVRNQYLKLKNYYLRRNDYNHPSFICYIEAVNNVYNMMKQKKYK